MQAADIEAIRMVRHELARHCLDSSFVSISAHYGVVHLNGEIRPMSGHEAKFEEEVHTLYRCLKNRKGIRDIVFDWKLPKGFEHVKIQRAGH
ncbi:MAG: hypothetical protein SFU56_09780 [Capsulimonadales bacterium]|nr:hypothetical protein [Capsulimonadales bacterium]